MLPFIDCIFLPLLGFERLPMGSGSVDHGPARWSSDAHEKQMEKGRRRFQLWPRRRERSSGLAAPRQSAETTRGSGTIPEQDAHGRSLQV